MGFTRFLKCVKCLEYAQLISAQHKFYLNNKNKFNRLLVGSGTESRSGKAR